MNGAALLALQHLDSTIDQLTTRRTRIPEVHDLASATAARDAWHGELSTGHRQVAIAEEAIAAAEREGVDLTARQHRLEQQLKTVIAPREAEALMHEIDRLKAEHGELDDRELAAMEEQAAESARIDELDAQAPAMQALVAVATEAYESAIAALDEARSEAVARRDAAREAIDASDLAEYDRRRARHAGVAVAALNGSRCEGCHLDLSRAEVDDFKRLPADVLAECPQCGRFLVR